jgi:hypothetical protein
VIAKQGEVGQREQQDRRESGDQPGPQPALQQRRRVVGRQRTVVVASVALGRCCRV